MGMQVVRRLLRIALRQDIWFRHWRRYTSIGKSQSCRRQVDQRTKAQEYNETSQNEQRQPIRGRKAKKK